jgi:anaerobic ribonucleoside-triphosphate reductase activating protein
MSVPTLSLSRAHFPVTALGPGRRVGLWLQGCSIECPGCISRDTWDPLAGHEASVEAVSEWVKTLISQGCDGVTISGGEPFEQPKALKSLLQKLTQIQDDFEGFDLLAYSGYSTKTLQHNFPDLLALLDVVITGPFVQTRAATLLWRGSTNQKIELLTDRAHTKYESILVQGIEQKGSFQICVSEDQVFYVGIPAPGDLDKIELAASKRGVVFGDASWRA